MKDPPPLAGTVWIRDVKALTETDLGSASALPFNNSVTWVRGPFWTCFFFYEMGIRAVPTFAGWLWVLKEFPSHVPGMLRAASFTWCFFLWLLGGEQPGSLAPSMAGFGTRVSWKNILRPKERELAHLEQWRALCLFLSPEQQPCRRGLTLTR